MDCQVLGDATFTTTTELVNLSMARDAGGGGGYRAPRPRPCALRRPREEAVGGQRLFRMLISAESEPGILIGSYMRRRHATPPAQMAILILLS